MCPPSCSRSPARYSGPSRTGSRSHSLPRCWRCLPVRLGRDRSASSSSGSTAPVGTLSRTWLFRRGSGWSTCPHTPPSFSPPSTSGPFWMSRSPTSTSRPLLISSTSSPSAVAFSIAISSNPAQTSTGGPSQLPRPDQPETVSFDQLVGQGEERARDREAERLCGLQIDRQTEARRILKRQGRWPRSLEKAVDKGCYPLEALVHVRPIGHQAPVTDEEVELVNGRHMMLGSEVVN